MLGPGLHEDCVSLAKHGGLPDPIGPVTNKTGTILAGTLPRPPTGGQPPRGRPSASPIVGPTYPFAYRGTHSVACTSPIVSVPVSNSRASGDAAGVSVPW